MKVNFYLTKSKTQFKPVKLFISLQGRTEVNTKVKVLASDWDLKKQRIKSKVIGSGEINQILDNLELKAWIVFKELSEKGFPNYKDIVSALLYKEDKKTVIEWFNEFINESKTRISSVTGNLIAPSTIVKYEICKVHLMEFEKKTKYPLTVENINENFYEKFRRYILEKGNCSNSFYDMIKYVKSFCKWLQRKEKTLSNDFRFFERHEKYADAKPLKERELNKLYNSVLIGYKEKARLIFLFLCSTGMRISDYNKLKELHIDGEFIIFNSQKTNSKCFIPFFDDLFFKPVQILAEMKEKFGEYPVISGQKLNTYLKEVFLDLSLTRIIPTSKTGRKTFATLKLLHGVPAEIIMKSTGHKTRSSFDAYVGIDTTDILKQYKDKAVNLKVG
ncbi:MAG: site-specific integrase [Bacteroidota bacterium]|nr:site-specific integrase [Bacteroidota bacterium]